MPLPGLHIQSWACPWGQSFCEHVCRQVGSGLLPQEAPVMIVEKHNFSFLAGKWKPSQTDVNGMVNSTMVETGGTPCILADMGAFHLAEFAHTLCRPFVGSAVHGGIHILQIGPMKLHSRMLTFPTLNSTFKVCFAIRHTHFFLKFIWYVQIAPMD